MHAGEEKTAPDIKQMRPLSLAICSLTLSPPLRHLFHSDFCYDDGNVISPSLHFA